MSDYDDLNNEDKANGHPPTKAQTYALIAKETGLTRKQVSDVFDSLSKLAQQHLHSETGQGVFAIPGLAKARVVEKAPTSARKGVNPFTGEPITIPAKPARTVIKLQPLKGLRDMI